MSRYSVRRFSTMDEYEYLIRLFAEMGNPAGDERLLKLISKYEKQLARETDPAKAEYLKKKLEQIKSTYSHPSGAAVSSLPAVVEKAPVNSSIKPYTPHHPFNIPTNTPAPNIPTPPVNPGSSTSNAANDAAKGAKRLGKWGKYGLIGAGVLGAGYLGKKLIDSNRNED